MLLIYGCTHVFTSTKIVQCATYFWQKPIPPALIHASNKAVGGQLLLLLAQTSSPRVELNPWDPRRESFSISFVVLNELLIAEMHPNFPNPQIRFGFHFLVHHWMAAGGGGIWDIWIFYWHIWVAKKTNLSSQKHKTISLGDRDFLKIPGVVKSACSFWPNSCKIKSNFSGDHETIQKWRSTPIEAKQNTVLPKTQKPYISTKIPTTVK